jgi:hypothetical protein
MDLKVTFHSNGAIRSGTLAAGATISGVAYEAGTKLRFSENGKVIEATQVDRGPLPPHVFLFNFG